MIAYRGVLFGLARKMFQGGGPPQGVMSRAANVVCFFGSRGRHGGAGREERWTVESELRLYGRAWACISLANTHPTQHRRLRRSSPRSKQRQSAKGAPALAYEHHQAWERLCTGTFDDITPPVPAPAHGAALAQTGAAAAEICPGAPRLPSNSAAGAPMNTPR